MSDLLKQLGPSLHRYVFPVLSTRLVSTHANRSHRYSANAPPATKFIQHPKFSTGRIFVTENDSRKFSVKYLSVGITTLTTALANVCARFNKYTRQAQLVTCHQRQLTKCYQYILATHYRHPEIGLHLIMLNVKCKNNYRVQNDESLRGHCTNERSQKAG